MKGKGSKSNYAVYMYCIHAVCMYCIHYAVYMFVYMYTCGMHVLYTLSGLHVLYTLCGIHVCIQVLVVTNCVEVIRVVIYQYTFKRYPRHNKSIMQAHDNNISSMIKFTTAPNVGLIERIFKTPKMQQVHNSIESVPSSEKEGGRR